MKSVSKIMFVCYGNICRSPMAEVIFKDMLSKRGVVDFTVCSSATSYDEIFGNIGNPIYPPAERELNKHGLTAGDKRARKLTFNDYPNYDLFICMDNNNVRDTIEIFNGDKESKVKTLLSFAGSNRSVLDPYFTNRFDIAYNDIVIGCQALLDYLV